jgi:hypothetical protein
VLTDRNTVDATFPPARTRTLNSGTKIRCVTITALSEKTAIGRFGSKKLILQ